jgi:hypothetical protein
MERYWYVGRSVARVHIRSEVRAEVNFLDSLESPRYLPPRRFGIARTFVLTVSTLTSSFIVPPTICRMRMKRIGKYFCQQSSGGKRNQTEPRAGEEDS